MKKTKEFRGFTYCLFVCVVAVIAILVVPFKVSADNLTTSPTAVGTCGTNAYWEYYEDSKTLYIHGTGGITSSSGGTYKANIREIIVGDDITSICSGAFKGCTNLEEITLPFIGKSRDAVGPEAVLGYIFGYATVNIFDIYSYTSYHTNDSYHCYVESSWGKTADDYFSYDNAGFLYNDNGTAVRMKWVKGTLIGTYNPNVLISYQLGITNNGDNPGNPNGTIWQFSAFDYLTYYNQINENFDRAWLRSYYYYIPQTLQTVNITNIDEIPYAAFNNCKNLSEINIYSYISTWGNYAYSGCSATVNYLGGRYYTPRTYSNGIYTLTYIVPNEEITITKCETTSESVVIPQSISNYPITAIGSNAFADMVNIKSVVIPTTVTSIADSAFYCCTSLTDVYYNGTKADWEKISIGENNGCLLNATIHFPVIAVSSVTLNKSSLEMWSGDEETLQATIVPSDATNKNIIWSSSDKTVVTVDDNGKIVAKRKGSATITATTEDGSKIAACEVVVHHGVTVDEFKIWETNYGNQYLTSEELYKKNHILDVSWSPIISRQSDTEDYDMYSIVVFNIVSNDGKTYSTNCQPNSSLGYYIDEQLKYTVPAGKTYTVSATLRLGYTKNHTFVEKASYSSNVITIDLPGCSYLKTSQDSKYLAEEATCGSPAKYYANCEHCGVNYDIIIPRGQVDPSNHIYGKWTSISETTHSRSCECGNKSETEPHTYENRVCVDCGVEDSRIYVNEVSLNKTSVELKAGESETLVASIAPANATNTDVVWSSLDDSVATVVNGTITGVKAGITTVTATTVDGSKTATCTVTVNEAPIVDADVTYTIGNASGKPGRTVEIALSVSSDVAVNGLLLDNLSYDENALEFVEFANYGDLITISALGANGVDSAKGEIALGYTDAVIPNGQICIIKFRVKDTAEDGEYTINIDGAASANGQKLPSKVNSGKITISKWVYGDFDSNEKLDMKDVVYFMNWINFSWTGKYPMGYEGDKDFNKDGSVDMEDVVYFMNWVNFSWTGKYDIDW